MISYPCVWFGYGPDSISSRSYDEVFISPALVPDQGIKVQVVTPGFMLRVVDVV